MIFFLPLIIRKRKNLVVVLAALAVGGSVLSFRQVDLSRHHFPSSGKYLISITGDPKPKSILGKCNGVPIRLMGNHLNKLVPSELIEAIGYSANPREGKIAALIFAKKIRVVKPPNRWQLFLSNIRNGLKEKVGTGDGASLIPGMVLGDTSLQSPEFSNEMRISGLTHLTAVSGANFAIVSAFILWISQWIFRKNKYRLIATSIFLVAFISLVRPSPSVLRAAAMAGVVIFSKIHRSQSDSIPALGFAIAIVITCDPWQARDPGFALSVLATAGLLLIAPRIKLPQLIAIPIAAMVLCTPILISLSGYLSISAIPANALVAPLVAPVTILGFISALLPISAPIFIPIAKIFAHVIAKIALVASSFPILQLTAAIFLIFAVVIFFISRKIMMVFLLLILLLTWLQRWPNNDWQVANCNVGQGDAMVVKVAKNQAAVFDTGPDPILIKTCLHNLGITKVPFLLITHSHADHAGGITGVPNVGQLITSAHRGDKFEVGEISIEILWPTISHQNYENLGEEGSVLNNESIVSLVRVNGYSIIITGDIEPEAQRQIAPYLTPVDVYKVAHHGSRYQDIEFTKKLKPKISVISVGVRNKYGHPALNTLKLLRNSKILRTDKDGAVAIDLHKNSISSSRVGAFGLPVLWRIS